MYHYLTVRKPKKLDGLHSTDTKNKARCARPRGRTDARQSETDAPDGRAGARGSVSTRTDRRVSGRGRIALNRVESRFRCVSFRRLISLHSTSIPRTRACRVERDCRDRRVLRFTDSGLDFDPVARDASESVKGIERNGIVSIGIEGVIGDVDVAGWSILEKRDARARCGWRLRETGRTVPT